MRFNAVRRKLNRETRTPETVGEVYESVECAESTRRKRHIMAVFAFNAIPVHTQYVLYTCSKLQSVQASLTYYAYN